MSKNPPEPDGSPVSSKLFNSLTCRNSFPDGGAIASFNGYEFWNDKLFQFQTGFKF